MKCRREHEEMRGGSHEKRNRGNKRGEEALLSGSCSIMRSVLMPNLAHERTVMRGGREQNMLYCIYMSAKASVQQVLGGAVCIFLCLYASPSEN